MTTPGVRLGSFALVLAGVFASAYGIGEAIPGHAHSATSGSTASQPSTDASHQHNAPATDPHAAPGSNGAGAGVAGLSSLVDGHRIVVASPTDATTATLTFHIEHNGQPVTAFDDAHGARLHLLVVSGDLSSFQHLHPSMDAAGTWSTPVTWPVGGPYRLVADLHPTDGEAMALGTDLVVPGSPSMQPLPAPSDDVTTPEGLRVVRHGAAFTVTPADELEPYLGQAAHLVAFRSGNNMYRHLHAESGAESGEFSFAWDLPPGTWRLFLQFSRLGQVITVPFTVDVPG